MPSPLAEISASRRALAGSIGPALRACFSVTISLLVAGCQADRGDVSAHDASRFYPPQPQVPRVVALGTLRGAPPPTKNEIKLSMFLFGVEPPTPLAIANPLDVAAHGVIC